MKLKFGIIEMLLLKGGFMRKRISKQNKPEKATISLKKILAISIILFMLMGMMGVMATTYFQADMK